MSGQNKQIATKTQVKAPDAPELNNMPPCWHCDGKGECDCPKCALSLETEYRAAYREDFDSGRQMEGTCRICIGLGRLAPDGKPLIKEQEVDFH